MAVALSSLFSMPNSHVGIPQTFRRTLPFSGNWRERRTRSDQRCIANLFASPSMNSMATSSKREGRERKGIIHLTNQANSQSALCRHRVWPIPSGPADVLGRDVVGGGSEPTADAFEKVPGGAVTLRDVAASGASTAGVPWVDRGHWNAGEPSLVLDEAPELRECPRVQDATLGLAGLYPGADAPEVFQGDAAARAMGLGDEPLGYPVVDATGEAGFPAGAETEKPSGGLGALALEPRPEAVVAATETVGMGTRECLAVRIGGDVHDAQIDAEIVFGGGGLGLRNFNGLEQNHPVFSDDEFGLAFGGKDGARSALKWNPEAVKADGAVALVGVSIDGHGTKRTESGGPRSSCLVSVGIGHFADRGYGGGARQPEPLPQFPVHPSLKWQPMPDFLGEGHAGEPVASRVEVADGFEESGKRLAEFQPRRPSDLHVLSFSN